MRRFSRIRLLLLVIVWGSLIPPVPAERIIIDTGSANFLTSDDEGNSWQIRSIPSKKSNTDLSCMGTSCWTLVGNEVFTSMDRGSTWNKVGNDLQLPGTAIAMVDRHIGYVVDGQGGVTTTFDGWQSSQRKNLLTTDEFSDVIAIGNTAYIANSEPMPRLRRSDDSWELLSKVVFLSDC